MTARAARQRPIRQAARRVAAHDREPALLHAPPDSCLRIGELHRAIGNQAVGRLLQRKLVVNRPGDAHEQEADRVADAVMRASQPGASPAVSRAAPAPRTLQRACSCGGTCVDCRQKEDKLQRKEASGITVAGAGAAAPPIVHEVLRSPGHPLDVKTRAFMEPRFGADFGVVRIHTDPEAHRAARAVDALAFTVERDIVFGAGHYAPDTAHGQRLIAHELAHVVQQRGSSIAPQRFMLSRPADTAERAADRAADAVLAGRRTPAQPQVTAATIARQHTCRTGHVLGQGELVPEREKSSNADLYYRIWGTWKTSDTGLNSFAERVVNAWIPWRFGPLTLVDRQKVSDFIFMTALGKVGAGAGQAGCDYAIVLSKPTLVKAVELSGEAKRAAGVKHAREELAGKPGEALDYVKATADQRLVLLEDRIRAFWTGNRDEQAILDIIKTTPDDQAAELSRRLSTDRYGEETYLAALDRVVDLGNNLDLHIELTKLHLRGLGGEKGAKMILEDAPVLPWHDVMGLGHDVPVTFSATKGAGGKVVIKYHRGNILSDTDMPYQDELDALPSEMKIGGRAFDADQLFKVHDWDENRFVVVRARDLIAYQNIGIRNWLGHMAAVASFAIPGGAAATTAGKVALFAIERAIPLLVLAIRENRLNLVKWFPTWGPRMIFFADVAELAIGLYGVASFARSGIKFFNAWRDARFARKLWEAAESVEDAEKAAVRIEKEADKILNAVDEFQHAESAAGNLKPKGLKSATGDAVADARSAAAETHGRPETGPHGAPTDEKVLASESVKGGHHVDVTKAGIELCSPKPCPLLRVEYATELKGNPALGKQMDALDALRKSDPPAAARKAADLHETLAYTRAHRRLFHNLPSHAKPAQEARLAKLLDAAEDASIHVSERHLEEISKRLRATRNPSQIEQELAALEQDLERATAVKGEVGEAAQIGGGSRSYDPAAQLPEGTGATGTTTKPRTATLTDPELLAANLTKRVGPRPPGHEAHHIVPKGMEDAEEARRILDRAGIGINDAENGIWLPRDTEVANQFASDIHSKVHTTRAVRLITEQLREGAKDGPAGVRRALRTIQRTLSDLKLER